MSDCSPNSRFKAVLLVVSCLALLSIHADAEKTKKADIRTPGTPGTGDGVQLVSDGADPVVRYPVAHQHTASGCYGYLYFSNSTIRFEVLSPDKDKGHSFQYPRTQLTTARQWIFMGTSFPEAEFKFSDGRTYHFFHIRRETAESSSPKLKGWNDVLDSNDLLQASRNLDDVLAIARAKATKAAGASALTGGSSTADNGQPLIIPVVPLTEQQLTTLAAEEQAGDEAAHADKPREALEHYLKALDSLPPHAPPPDHEQPLLERILKMVNQLRPGPSVSDEAERYATYAMLAVQNAKGPADLKVASEEWDKALRLAPWWADAYYNRGLLSEKRGAYANAVRDLQLYLLASPSAQDKDAIQQKIYSLEFKTGKR